MNLKLPVVLLSALALATAAPLARAQEKDKDKAKGHSEQRDDDRDDDRAEGDHHHGDGDDAGKITICHVPPGNHAKRHTISVGASAWDAHRAHGDYRGECRSGTGGGTSLDRFDALDTNHDGVLSRAEFARF